MSEHIREIASRIKVLREISGISIEDLAKELQINVDTYLSFESGLVDIPVSLLYSLSTKYKVELSAILSGDGPKLHTYCVVRKENGKSVERTKKYKYQSLAYNFINKKAEPFHVTVEPEDESTPIHYNFHTGHEFNYVLEGALKVYINDKEIILNEGDSLYFDASVNHGMKAMGGKIAKFLAIII